MLNVIGLKCPIKRGRQVGWIIKQDPTTGHLQETHFTTKKNKDQKWMNVKKEKENNKNYAKLVEKGSKQE